MSRTLRRLAQHIASGPKLGTPLRHGRAVVVSSTIGTSVVTPDGGATNITAFNYGHVQKLPAGAVVDVLYVGRKTYVIGAYSPVVPRSPYGASVYRSAAWTTVSTMSGPFAFDAVPTGGDPSSMFSTGTHEFTIPVPGRYLVIATVSYAQTAAGQWIWLQIQQNGTAVLNAPPINGGTNFTNPSGETVSGILNCAAGDVLALFTRAQAAALTGLTGPSNTSMQVELLSAT